MQTLPKIPVLLAAVAAAVSSVLAEPGGPRTAVRDDQTLVINDRPWFPVGVAPASPRRAQGLSRGGFNMVPCAPADIGDDGYGVPVGFDMAVGYGQRCLFVPPGDARAAEDFLAHYRTALRRHPAIALWDVTDDASGDVARFLREADADHPLYAEFPSIEAFRQDGRGVAVAGFACAGEALPFCRRLKEEVLPGAPALCVFPAVPDRDVRDVRFEAYVALIHGVRGLVWRPAAGTPPFLVEEAAAYTNVAREARAMVPGLVSKERRAFAEGDLLGLVCGNARDRRFLILVNASGRRIEANFEVPELEKVAKVVLPFATEEELRADVPVINEDELEKPAIFGDEMGIEVPQLENDLLVATDAEIKALAAARKQARKNPGAEPPPAITLKARATGAAGEVIVKEAPPEKTLEIFCGRVRHIFPPHGTLVYRW